MYSSVRWSTWTVQLGRKDSRTANFAGATSDLNTLILAFAKKGLNATDMVALSGRHTIGQAKCKNFCTRIDTEPKIDSTYAASLKKNCSDDASDDDNLSPLDGRVIVFDKT
ncbi:unnamed protein product [Dovyalis caffra]|uniref:peroxidase n=1 Tax=Dovyalis caffra TaxID=77055 RepID=A0AAV1S8B9_9ROSI|nr:unnamed protein product [Dovyalis caffra]